MQRKETPVVRKQGRGGREKGEGGGSVGEEELREGNRGEGKGRLGSLPILTPKPPSGPVGAAPHLPGT